MYKLVLTQLIKFARDRVLPPLGVLCLAVGAKVMLVVNIDVSDSLVNGALGTVSGIITTGSQVTTILVKFNSDRVGVAAIQKSHYRQDYPDSVPITRHEATFRIGRNKASRAQFPLVLSWAKCRASL